MHVLECTPTDTISVANKTPRIAKGDLLRVLCTMSCYLLLDESKVSFFFPLKICC